VISFNLTPIDKDALCYNITYMKHDHSKCTSSLIAKAKKTCSVKLTKQRLAVLTCVAEKHVAVGAYDLIERMATVGPRPAPITVYRALDFLLEHNLVHKIESRNSFIACGCDHENAPPTLLICDNCGNVDEIVLSENIDLKNAALMRGFKIERAVIELSGQCRACNHV
jgi:Fur family transcriptional regulator, zinc uptake regulator